MSESLHGPADSTKIFDIILQRVSRGAVLYRIILRVGGATYIKFGYDRNGLSHWRFQLGYHILDLLLHLETTAHQSQLWTKFRFFDTL